MNGATPKLRFPGHNQPWRDVEIGRLLERVSIPVEVEPEVQYRENGIRSHGRGAFHKEWTTGFAIGEKRVFKVVPDCLVLNIVFAWEQAVAITSEREVGFIASHRFPMFKPRPSIADLEFLRQFFLTGRGRQVLEIASPGGAGRNKTLGQSEFLKLKVWAPALCEQNDISNALATVDRKIALLREKRDALEQFKTRTMERLFRREVRFRRDDGSAFPEWDSLHLRDVIDSLHAGTSVNSLDVPAKEGTEGVLKTSCVATGRFVPSENKAVVDPIEKRRLKEPVRAGTIVISRMNTSAVVGASAYVHQDMPNLFLPDRLWAATAKPDVCPRWLSFVLSGSEVSQAVAERATGTSGSMKNLSKVGLLGVRVLVPHLEEQRRLLPSSRHLTPRSTRWLRRSSAWKTFRKGLIQGLFP